VSAPDLMMVDENGTRGPAEDAEHLSRSAKGGPAWRLLAKRGRCVAVDTSSRRARFAEHCRQVEPIELGRFKRAQISGEPCPHAPARHCHDAVRKRRARAVTRGTWARERLIFNALRQPMPELAACPARDAFRAHRIHPWRLRFSRTLGRGFVPAPLQALVPAPTRWGPTTPHRGCRVVPLYSPLTEEIVRCLDALSSTEGAEWTAYRPTPARALRAQRISLLASMSQLRSVVLVTPLFATASRVDLNTYRFAGPSSKQPKPPRSHRCRR